MPKDFTTVDDDELTGLALGCRVLLEVDAAQKYGLVSGGPKVEVERCEMVLALAAERGIELRDEDLAEARARLIAELSAG